MVSPSPSPSPSLSSADDNKNDSHHDEPIPLIAPSPPPPPPPPPTQVSLNLISTAVPIRTKISSLDFERVINQYSIQAIRDRLYYDDNDENYNQEPVLPEEMLPLATMSSSSSDQYDVNDNDVHHHHHHHHNHNDGTKTTNVTSKNSKLPMYNTFDASYRQRHVSFSSTKDIESSIPTTMPKSQHLQKDKKINDILTGQVIARWVLTIIIGIFTGLVAIFIVECTKSIVDWRSAIMDQIWAAPQDVVNNPSYTQQDRVINVAIFYCVINLLLSITSAILCLIFSPRAAGSGIPEVKAYLNGVRVESFTNISLFVVKIVATILSVSSGLACGPEGPLIHLGAILGASLCKISAILQSILRRISFLTTSSTTTSSSKSPSTQTYHQVQQMMQWITMNLSSLSNDAERRDMVSIGAAAGFAAAFGAPIGGLLFSLEEAASYFSHSMFLRTLAATSTATFCLAILHGDLSNYSVIDLGHYNSPNDNIFLSRFAEVPLYIFIAISGGVLGGFFVKAWSMIQQQKTNWMSQMSPRTKFAYQLGDVALLSLVTSVVTFYLSTQTWACKGIELSDDIISNKIGDWNQHEHQVLCVTHEVNEVSAVLFGEREEPIAAILTDPGQFDSRTLLSVGLVFFPLMLMTLGVALPSGIFMPSILTGCCLGGYMGMVFQNWFSPDISPATFALLGAAALLAGIQRSSVSLCVILVEGTGQVKVLIPVIITVVIARYVGQLITKEGLYETAMELVSHYPYLDHEEKRMYDIFPVRDIMSTPPICIGPCEQAHFIERLLRQSSHHGFPVVDKTRNKFLGLVRRDQLVALLECGVFMKQEDGEINNDDATTTTKPHTKGALDNNFQGGAHYNIGGTLGGKLPSGSTTPEKWQPEPGVSKSPLMGLAYHISDDRYDNYSGRTPSRGDIENHDGDDDYDGLDDGDKENIDNDLENNRFDRNAWLVNIRSSLRNAQEMGVPLSFITGDDSLPPIGGGGLLAGKSSKSLFQNSMEQQEEQSSSSVISSIPSVSFGQVRTNKEGMVMFKVSAPYKNEWINIAAVMNQGTYTVTEFCPVSKVLALFTALGLRHLIVLGGKTGGNVIGIVTRANLIPSHMESLLQHSNKNK